MASGLRRSGGGGNNITVAVRVRPLSEKEQARKSHNCLVVQEGKQINVNDPDTKMGGIDYLRLDKTKDRSYAFDHAFDISVDQREVFEKTTMPVVGSVVAGCNACCFAYGATGAFGDRPRVMRSRRDLM